MQITVVKEFTFDAAHYLPEYDGPCQNLHGHTYRLQVGFEGPVQSNGMVMDFSIMKKEIGKIISQLDHSLLNELELTWFPTAMPTAENMVRWLHERLRQIPNMPYLAFIRLYETPTSYAEWRKEEEGYNWLGIDQEELEETLRRR